MARLKSYYPPQICSICHGPYVGHGNNAWPFQAGRCCDECNDQIVVPARIALIKKEEDTCPTGSRTTRR